MRSLIKARAAGGRLSLFFVEMIIVLLFFAIASAVIMKAFAVSDRISEESSMLEKMSFCAQSAAETFSNGGSLSETAEIMFGIEVDEVSEIIVPLDENCVYNSADADIYMTMTVTERAYEGRFAALQIKFSDDEGAVLYEINSGAFVQANSGRTVSGGE